MCEHAHPSPCACAHDAHERTVSDALAAQRELIAAALSRGGPRAVLDALARALGCWCLALNVDGTPRHAVPTQALRQAARLRLDLERLELGSLLRSASLDLGDDQVTVLPIGAGGRRGGFLAAGRRTGLLPAEHSVLTSAAGLLSLDLASHEALAEAERRARRAVLRVATGERPEMAGDVAATLGVALPPAPVRVAVLGTGRTGVAALLRAAESHVTLNQASALVGDPDAYTVLVVLPVAEGDRQALEEVLHRVPGARGVVTEEVADYADLPDALRRARSVFFGQTTGAGRLIPAKEAAASGLLAQLDTPGARGWAEALLEPLDRHARRSKLDLASTLRVYLANNGHVDASAAALGIHRHTLRYRLRRIVELLGSDLDDPTQRAELWLALRLREGAPLGES